MKNLKNVFKQISVLDSDNGSDLGGRRILIANLSIILVEIKNLRTMKLLLFIPLVPLLGFLGIGAGIATLAWYYNQPKEKQDRANQLAWEWFGKAFKELAKHEQQKIEQRVNDEFIDI